jgi:excisionase family DNA binding protein
MSAVITTKPIPSKCFSVNGFAEYLGVVPLTVRREIDRKKIKAVKVGRRVVITPANAEAYLKANEVQ